MIRVMTQSCGGFDGQRIYGAAQPVTGPQSARDRTKVFAQCAFRVDFHFFDCFGIGARRLVCAGPLRRKLVFKFGPAACQKDTRRAAFALLLMNQCAHRADDHLCREQPV